MMEPSSFKAICTLSSGGDDFVGVRSAQEGQVEVRFPQGYHLDWDNEERLKEDVRLLLRVLARFFKRQGEYLRKYDPDFSKGADVPVEGYRQVIEYYLNRGHYYIETERIYKTDTKGKTDWSKTIKNNRPEVINGSIVYLKRTVRSSKPNENNLLTLSNKWCVYQALRLFGWLYGVPTPPKPDFSVTEGNRGLCLSLLRSKASRTFVDDDRRLFRSMIAIIEKKADERKDEEFFFGVKGFQYVWEGMIDEVFGIPNKDDYFPKASWKERGSGNVLSGTNLRPDSIMEHGDGLYVLDAKYYSYGTKESGSLPGTADIAKQIVYGEYAKGRSKKEKIYNAFVMPFAKEEHNFDPSLIRGWIGNVAEATGEWKGGDEPYEKIQGIVMDIKTLMKAYCQNEREHKGELADAIASGFSKEESEAVAIAI